MIARNTIKYRVTYIGKGIYRCAFEYEFKGGDIQTFVSFGYSHNDAIEKALNNYKQLVLIGF